MNGVGDLGEVEWDKVHYKTASTAPMPFRQTHCYVAEASTTSLQPSSGWSPKWCFFLLAWTPRTQPTLPLPTSEAHQNARGTRTSFMPLQTSAHGAQKLRTDTRVRSSERRSLKCSGESTVTRLNRRRSRMRTTVSQTAQIKDMISSKQGTHFDDMLLRLRCI